MRRPERGRAPLWRLGLVAWVALAGCAAAPPEATLDAYRAALEAGDAPRLYALSDPATRARVTPEAFAARLAAAPPARWGAVEALQVFAVATLADGRQLRLVQGPDGWRVAEGGVALAAYDTPEAALATLLAGAEAGRLDEVRGALPEAFQARYAGDAALAAHLAAVRGRLAAARSALGALTPGRARIQGDRAQLPYGEGRAVELVLEAGRWRVLDVE